MLGSQDDAGRPRPLMKMMSWVMDGLDELMAGKRVYEIGDEGLLGIVSSLVIGTSLEIDMIFAFKLPRKDVCMSNVCSVRYFTCSFVCLPLAGNTRMGV